MVIASVASSLLHLEPASLPQAPRHPDRLPCCAVRATVACSATRIRNQRPARGLETLGRTIFHTACRLCACLRLLVLVLELELVRTPITVPARVSWPQTLRKLATDKTRGTHVPGGPVGRTTTHKICVCPILVPPPPALSPPLSLAPFRNSLPRKRSFAPMQRIFHACHGAGSGRSEKGPVATRNLTSRTRHLLSKSRPSARPAGPSLMRSARPNTQSPPPSALLRPRNMEENARPSRPAWSER